MKIVGTLKGHHNICKNFVKVKFMGDGTIFSASEDGFVYIWQLPSLLSSNHENIFICENERNISNLKPIARLSCSSPTFSIAFGEDCVAVG